MSGIEVAALIAACSFLGLVVFLVLKLNPVLNKLDKTIDHVNNSIEIITRDVDNLSIEVEGLLNKTNALVDDINFDKISDKIICHGIESQYCSKKLCTVERISMRFLPFLRFFYIVYHN